MAKRVIFETLTRSDEQEGPYLVPYPESLELVPDTNQISLETSEFYEHMKVSRSYTDIEIQHYSGSTIDTASLYEYKLLSEIECWKYRVARIRVMRHYRENWYGDFSLSPSGLQDAIKILNKFNTMRTDEYIVVHVTKEYYDNIDSFLMANDSIFVTNYGKILKIVSGDFPVFELYDFDFKIEEKYYNTLYDIENKAGSEEELMAHLRSFILTLKKNTITKDVVEIIPVTGIVGMIVDYAI